MHHNGQAFYNKTILSALKKTSVLISNIPPELSFIIIQVHAQETNLTLDIQNAQNKITQINGSNIGLQLDSKAISFTQINVINNNNKTVPALIAITAYTLQGNFTSTINLSLEIIIIINNFFYQLQFREGVTWNLISKYRLIKNYY